MALRLAPQEADTDSEVSDEGVMTERAARQITNLIRSNVSKIADLLLQAYERRAYLALGYADWPSYIDAEFDFTERHARRLVAQGRAMRALAAAPVAADARVRVPPVTTRMAAAIGDDYEGVAAAWAERVQTGEKPEEALVEAVAARKAERKVIPVDSTETPANGHRPRDARPDPEAIMAAAADLRPRLRAWLEEVKAAVRNAPKANQEADTPEALLDELHDWVATMAAITADNRLKPVYRLLGETYVIAKAIGGPGERAVLAEISDCTIGNIDYRVHSL